MPNIEGTGFNGRAAIISMFVHAGMDAYLVREPGNAYDCNAIAVYIKTSFLFLPLTLHIGYVDRNRASVMAPKMDSGVEYDAYVLSLYTGKNHPRVTVSWKARGMKKVKG
jgi:hypothetical protein